MPRKTTSLSHQSVGSMSYEVIILFFHRVESTQSKRGTAKAWPLTIRMELDLIGWHALQPLSKFAISDSP